MLGLLWLAYASFGVISGTIAPLVDPMIADLNMSYSQMGLVLGTWQLIYIFTAIPLGTLVDRIGVTRAITVGILVIWLSLVLRGIAVNFFTLFLAVALFGFGGPIISIGAPKVVALWFRGSERGLAAGLYTTAPIIGLAVSLAVSPTWVIQLTGSWRGTSLIFGIFVFIVLICWIMLAREPNPFERKPRNAAPSISSIAVLTKILSLRNMQIMLIVAIFSFFLNHGLNNWLPSVLGEKGKSLSESGSLAAMGTAIGAVGLLIIPRVAIFGRRRIILSLLIALSALTTYGLAKSTDAMGQAGGLFFAAAEIGGVAGPLILGLLRDATGSLNPGLILLSCSSAGLLFIIPWIREKVELPGTLSEN
jgi:cyanate permease